MYGIPPEWLTPTIGSIIIIDRRKVTRLKEVHQMLRSESARSYGGSSPEVAHADTTAVPCPFATTEFSGESLRWLCLPTLAPERCWPPWSAAGAELYWFGRGDGAGPRGQADSQPSRRNARRKSTTTSLEERNARNTDQWV